MERSRSTEEANVHVDSIDHANDFELLYKEPKSSVDDSSQAKPSSNYNLDQAYRAIAMAYFRTKLNELK